LVRFAVISDIHANLSALQAVLHAIEVEEEPVDRVICAGDTVGRGPHPNEVLGLLRDRAVEVVRGNYDDAIAYDRIGSGVDFADAASEAADQQALAWTRRTVTPQNLEYLRHLPRDVRLFPLPSGVRVKRDELRKRQSEYGRSLFRRAIFGSLYRPTPERIKRELDGADRPIRVNGDPMLLQIIVGNLVSNALDAVAGVDPPRIAVALATAEGHAEVRVEDNGPGVEGGFRERLFEPFVTGKPEGVGLGLAVARSVAEAHGGLVSWDRQDGRTCFRVELPRAEELASSRPAR